MALFALRRLLLSIPLLIGITFVSYVVIGLAPGGPLDFLTPEDPNASPEVKERLIKEFGLDKPIHVQYWQWLKRAVRLDFGRSFLPDGRPVSAKIAERLPVTLFLNLIELAIIVGLAVPIGVLSATRQYSLYDKITTIFVFVGFATPDFWLALLLMILFGVQLGWLPISGSALAQLGVPLVLAAAVGLLRPPGPARSWSPPSGASPGSRATCARACSRWCARTTCRPRAPRVSPSGP